MTRYLINNLFLMGLFGFGCGGNAKQLIEITSRSDDDFQDIVLTVVDSKRSPDGEYQIIAKGKHNNEVVGLKVLIKDNLKAGFASDEIDNTAFASNGVTFVSIGAESDMFIRVLSKLYTYPTDKAFSNETILFDVFSLNEERADLEKGYYKFKLFFDPNDEFGLYAELYLNINLPAKEIEINEKDPEYREALIKAITR